MSERVECVDDRSLLVADHPHFLEIDAERRRIFRNVADVLVPRAAGQDILLPITRGAAVAASLEADELAVGMSSPQRANEDIGDPRSVRAADRGLRSSKGALLDNSGNSLLRR